MGPRESRLGEKVFFSPKQAISWVRKNTLQLRPWIAEALQGARKVLTSPALGGVTDTTRRLFELMTLQALREELDNTGASPFERPPHLREKHDDNANLIHRLTYLQILVAQRNKRLEELLGKLAVVLSPPPVGIADPREIPPNPHLAILAALGEYSVPVPSRTRMDFHFHVKEYPTTAEATMKRGARNLAFFIAYLLRYAIQQLPVDGKIKENEVETIQDWILGLVPKTNKADSQQGKTDEADGRQDKADRANSIDNGQDGTAENPENTDPELLLRIYIGHFALIEEKQLKRLVSALTIKWMLGDEAENVRSGLRPILEVITRMVSQRLQEGGHSTMQSRELCKFFNMLSIDMPLNDPKPQQETTREEQIGVLLNTLQEFGPNFAPPPHYTNMPIPRRPVTYDQFIEALKAVLPQTNDKGDGHNKERGNEILRYYEIREAILKIVFSLMNPQRAIWQSPDDIARIARTTGSLSRELGKLRKREMELLKKLKELQELLTELREIIATTENRIQKIRELINEQNPQRTPFPQQS